MNPHAILQDLGLSETETTVYLSLLQLGASPVSRIGKDTGIKRTSVYPVLKSLTAKGFVSLFFKGSERYYQAQRPQKLAHYYENKLKAFTDIVPSLNSVTKKQAAVLGLRFIETKDELEKFYGEILDRYRNRNYDIIGSASGWEGIDPEFFIQFRKDRGQANIKTRLLLTAESRRINPQDPKLLRQVRFLPEGYEFRSTIDIYKDQILIVSPELSSLAVVVAIPAMTDIFHSVFELLWDMIGNN
jgi:sugar-specific transcriptional regulator TrmB